MFYSYKDTKEKLDYLESSKVGRESPINVNWLIETLRETNDKAERYEKALKDIVDNAGKFYPIELVEIAKEAVKD